jgi:hypothetical protein
MASIVDDGGGARDAGVPRVRRCAARELPATGKKE